MLVKLFRIFICFEVVAGFFFVLTWCAISSSLALPSTYLLHLSVSFAAGITLSGKPSQSPLPHLKQKKKQSLGSSDVLKTAVRVAEI